nr:hypothetical protein B0A51_02516 [Rachicladosporium sp. CCFEE 5018]
MLENLTIVGLPDLPGQDIVSSEADGPGMTVCLTQALSNLRLHSRSGSLRSLVLSVQDAVTRDHHYHVAMYSKDQIRACAFSTERIVAQAVKASAIPIETVELYGSSFVLVVTSNEKLEDGGYHIDQSHNISALLTQLSQLERLDLRWCNARRTDLTGADLIDRLFFAGVAPLSFTSLNDLSLKGIYTTSTDLLTFLQRHVQLRNLCLERVKLLDGTFDPIFGHMSDIMELDSFYMCDLSHASEFARLQFIGVVGRNLYGHGGPPTRIRREGVHTRERLQYKIITERVRGDGRNQRYYRDVKDRFD